MFNKKILLASTIVATSVACVPTSPILKDVSVSVTAGGAVYSLNEYCSKFSQQDRLRLRNTVNTTSIHKAVITCAGDQ